MRQPYLSRLIILTYVTLTATLSAQISSTSDLTGPDSHHSLDTYKLLNNITFAKIAFTDTRVSDIFEYLQKRSQVLDPDKKGINFILYLANHPEHAKGLVINPKLTFTADNISMLDVVDYICKKCKLKTYLAENIIVAAYNFTPNQKLETRIYPLEQQGATEVGGGESNDAVMDFFKRRNIPFPTGANIVYDTRLSRLIATNTPANLRLIEEIIETLNVVDPQVLIRFSTIRIKQDDMHTISANWYRQKQANKNLAPNKWETIMNSDKSELVSTASILTLNGQEGVIRAVSEKFYPEAWSEEKQNDTPKATEKKGDKTDNTTPPHPKLKHSAIPCFGDPTELGTVLRVTPNVDADNYTISLDMNPVIQTESGKTTYQTMLSTIIMPKLKSLTTETNVTIYDGHTIPLSQQIIDHSKPGHKNRICLMTFLTVQLQNPDGTPISANSEFFYQPAYWAREVKQIPKAPAKPKPLQKLSFVQSATSFQQAFMKIATETAKERDGLKLDIKLSSKDLTCPGLYTTLNDFPVKKIIKYFCTLSGCIYRFTQNTITIEPYQTTIPPAAMKIKIYRLRMALISSLLTNPSDETEEGEDLLCTGDNEQESSIKGQGISYYSPKLAGLAINESFKTYFKDRGVSFPAGSDLKFDRKTSSIYVKNTPENLRRLSLLLRDLDIVTPLVLIETQLVKISQQALATLNPKLKTCIKSLDQATIQKILASDQATIIASSQVIATSGSTSITRLVDQEYYPESWTEIESSSEKQPAHTPSYPEFGDPSDLGFRFEVTPTVSPNNFTINLELNPQLIQFGGWNIYPYTILTPLNKLKQSTVKMPVLIRNDMNANIKVYDGQTVMAGYFQAPFCTDSKSGTFFNNVTLNNQLSRKTAEVTPAEFDNLFFFVKAQLINSDGNTVRINHKE